MNISSSFERISRFVVDNPKIVKKIYKTPNYNDEPQLYQYSSQFVDSNSLKVSADSIAAAGETIYDAIYRGVCEVIERDSFMIHYYNNLNSPRINLQALGNKKISKIIEIFKRYNLELCVNDITTDIGVPAVVSIVIDRTGMGPAVCVGLKAGFDMNQNVIGATEEALMVRSWIRDEYMYLKPKHSSPKIIRSIEERANFWCPMNTIHYLDFWLSAKNNKGPYKLRKFRQGSYKEKVTELIRILGSKGYDVVYVDITAPEIRKYGIKVVKVIVPQLQPLHLDEKYPYLTFRRLYNAPVDMGVLGRPKAFKELNNIPHPFL